MYYLLALAAKVRFPLIVFHCRSTAYVCNGLGGPERTLSTFIDASMQLPEMDVGTVLSWATLRLQLEEKSRFMSPQPLPRNFG